MARLRTNDPRIANRFIYIKGVKYPIMHLSMADVDIFKCLTEKLDDVFVALSNGEFLKFLEEKADDLIDFLGDDVPIAAGIVLKKTASECKSLYNPVTMLRVVIQQWIHNFEIDKVQRLYPMPEDDEVQSDLEGQPEGNPCSMDERLCSNFHWTLEQSQAITFPQAYLISNESAWSYAKIKAHSEDDKPKGKKITARAPEKKGAKRFIERFGDTPEEQRDGYMAYMQEHFGEMRIREVKSASKEGI